MPVSDTKLNRRFFLGGIAGGGLTTAMASAAAADNEKIQAARQAALSVLNPSQKDLDHGLELHGSSVVFDAYGFSPRAAVDGDRIRVAVQAGATEIELRDLREEMSMTRQVTSETERKEYLEAWDASGVTCVFQNCGQEGQDPMRLMKRLARFTFVTDFLRDSVGKAVVPEDVVAAKKQKKHCLYFTGNGVPLTQSWVSVEDELRYIRIFFDLGIRMMHMTYNRRNMIGDGCAEPSNAGLSDFGRAVVDELNRVGVIPDVAHSGWQTSLETAERSQKPAVASHSTCAGLHKHIRSKPDSVIKALADTDGYIGICCIPRYLGGSGDIGRLLDHVDYVAKRFGVEHVAIGTDVAYSSRNAARENAKIPGQGPSRDHWEMLWPPDPFQTSQQMSLSVAWTNWPLFTVGLVQRGYSDSDIQKIIGGNVLRVARATLPDDLPL